MTIEELRIALDEARKERDAAKEELEKNKAIMGELDSLSVNLVQDFPLTNKAIDDSKKHIEAIVDSGAEAGRYVEKAREVKKALTLLRQKREEAEKALIKVDILSKIGEFDEAFKLVESLRIIYPSNDPFVDEDYGMRLKLQDLLRDIADWTHVRVFARMAERRIDNGLLPATMDEILAETALIEKLDPSLESRHSKKKYADFFNGYYCLARIEIEMGKSHSLESLKELVKDYEAAAERGAYHKRTEYRLSLLKKCIADEFAELHGKYFIEDRDYESSLELYKLRKNVEPDLLPHEAYKLAETEEDFKRYFDINDVSTCPKEEFGGKSDALLASAPLSSYEEVIACPTLDPDNFEEGFKKIIDKSFEEAVTFLAETREMGLMDARLNKGVEMLLEVQEKTGDLEKMAPSLLYIKKETLPDSLQGITKLIKCLLRSPKAHRVVTKSNLQDLHSLSSEKEEFLSPIGKPSKSNSIKAWGKGKLAAMIIFAIIVPVLVAIGGAVALYLSPLEVKLASWLQTIPLMILPIVFVIFSALYCCRDERKSSRRRNVVGVYSLLLSAFAIVFFILHKESGVDPALAAIDGILTKFGYGAFAAGFFSLLVGFFVLKPSKKRYNFIVYLPALLVFLGATVMLILGLRSGNLALI